MRYRLRLWLLAVVMAGCASAPTTTPTLIPTDTREAPKLATDSPAFTSVSTEAATVTATYVSPTDTPTPLPTATQAPSFTPQPTATKVKATVTRPASTRVAPTNTKVPVVAPTIPPSLPATATDTPLPPLTAGVQLIGLTSSVAKGANATITIKVPSGASCSIAVIYQSGPSSAAGLGPQTAAGDGRVTWTWKVGTRTTPGTWPIEIDCTPGGHAEFSFTVQ